MKLVGYTDRLSVPPGATISFMISSELASYRARLVRLIHGDTNEAGPGFKAQEIPCDVAGEYPGVRQPLCVGSYVRVPLQQPLSFEKGFTVHVWAWATTPSKRAQTLMALGDAGPAVKLSEGRLGAFIADENLASLSGQLVEKVWYSLAIACDSQSGTIRISLRARDAVNASLSEAAIHERSFALDSVAGEIRMGQGFNGKLDSPKLYNRALTDAEIETLHGGETIVQGLLGAWDFSRDIGSDRVTDVSGNELHGRCVNRPTRAVAGRAWDGSEEAWRNAPEQYAAIHFHDDDLDDAGWTPAMVWKVPEGTPSGIYALWIQGEDQEDYLPFAIRPQRGHPTARIAFLMPTFSYLAYANSHVAGRPEIAAMARLKPGPRSARYPSSIQDKYIVANRLNSLYDTHSDGSGVCHASWRRPLVTLRPKYIGELQGTKVAHQFNADLHLIDWLTEASYSFDVIADEDLHREGLELLQPYKVLITGTHPEYWSERMLKSCKRYLESGGCMMYLGGNGMYWLVEYDEQSGHAIELRRSQPSAPRFFEPHPGELHFSISGKRAAPCKLRGLPTQEWLGVVMSGAGNGGQHYERCPDSFDSSAAWIFAGIEPQERIGAFRNLLGYYGAAGGEVDKVDHRMPGTPLHTKVLATSARFDNSWVWDPIDPPSTPRSDMALLEYPNGGAVFSAASVGWCGCLSHDNYDNNVSRITRNVLEGFLKR